MIKQRYLLLANSDLLLSHAQLFVTPWTAACQASLSITISQSLLKLRSVDLVMPPNHLISVVPFFSCLQPFPASGSFTLNQLLTSGGPSIGASVSAISPSNEYARLVPFRIDWFDLLAVQHKTVFFLLWSFLQTVPVSSVCYSAPQGTTKSLGQCRPSQASWTWSWL